MEISATTAAIVGILTALGSTGGVLYTARYYRRQTSADRKVDTDGAGRLVEVMSNLNETLTKGVFDQNARHAADMAAERERCDGQLSRMGARLDDANEAIRHVERGARANMLAMAGLLKVPPDKVEASAAEHIRRLELDGNAVAEAAK